MTRRLAKVTAAVAVAAALVTTSTEVASAAALTNYFSAYDFRYEEPYNCGTVQHPEWVCYVQAPIQTGNVSYWNAPGLTRTFIYDSIGGRANSMGFVLQPKQNAGIMCWKAASNGGIWDLVDTRQQWTSSSTALVIGWVPDGDVVLTRADRLTIAECGYTMTVTGPAAVKP